MIPARYDGSKGFPLRSSDHEKVATSQTDPAVRRLHAGGANLHHHGADEERQPAGVPPGQGPDDEAHPADRHVGPDRCRDGVLGVTELYPQRPSSQVRPDLPPVFDTEQPPLRFL